MNTAVSPTPAPPFQSLSALIRGHAQAQPTRPALMQGDTRIDYATLDALMDRVAASLQRDGLQSGDAIAVCAHATPLYAVVFLGALRAGVAVAPLAPSVTPESFTSMLGDAHARRLFIDAAALDALGEAGTALHCIALDDTTPGTPFERWLMPEGSKPAPVEAQPEWPFNIIYSSGTTGQPKGIVQSHGMRWTHVMRGASFGRSEERRVGKECA